MEPIIGIVFIQKMGKYSNFQNAGSLNNAKKYCFFYSEKWVNTQTFKKIEGVQIKIYCFFPLK